MNHGKRKYSEITEPEDSVHEPPRKIMALDENETYISSESLSVNESNNTESTESYSSPDEDYKPEWDGEKENWSPKTAIEKKEHQHRIYTERQQKLRKNFWDVMQKVKRTEHECDLNGEKCPYHHIEDPELMDVEGPKIHKSPKEAKIIFKTEEKLSPIVTPIKK